MIKRNSLACKLPGCHVQSGGLAETVTVETLDRVNEAGMGGGEWGGGRSRGYKKKTTAGKEGEGVKSLKLGDLFAKSRHIEWVLWGLMRRSV